jgi:hypothetical protein
MLERTPPVHNLLHGTVDTQIGRRPYPKSIKGGGDRKDGPLDVTGKKDRVW